MNQRLKREFDRLNHLHWDGQLLEIEIIGSRALDGLLGEYHCPDYPDMDHPDEYRIFIDITQPRAIQVSTLLHEMCHHSVFLANKDAYYANRLQWHGRKWKKEMKRVGFKGKITQYT